MSDKRVSPELIGTILPDLQTEQRDDLELMIKAELMGRFGYFETQIDHCLGRIEDRVAALERQPSG